MKIALLIVKGRPKLVCKGIGKDIFIASQRIDLGLEKIRLNSARQLKLPGSRSPPPPIPLLQFFFQFHLIVTKFHIFTA